MASYKTQVDSENETSTLELSREAVEAALKARKLRERIEKFFSLSNESDKGESEDVYSESELIDRNIFYFSESSQGQYSLREAIEQLEGAAKALKEVSLESSLRVTENIQSSSREVGYPRDTNKSVHSEENVRSQYTEETGTTTETLEISDFELDILTCFKPSKSLREKLLQNTSQRRWRDEALELVHESKHLTILWNNTF
ncbi:hypothetical protein Gasu2_22390 [Galdieria sulphuraria]|nr:hypothetical protein Gasu2_22390 [Galdieria sulphuraria]